jgi:hypothetical protein
MGANARIVGIASTKRIRCAEWVYGVDFQILVPRQRDKSAHIWLTLRESN